MFDFHFNVSADVSALESQMADLRDKLAEIKATIAAERAEVAEAIAALDTKVGDLQAAVAADEAKKADIEFALEEIKAGVEGIFTKTVEVPPAE